MNTRTYRQAGFTVLEILIVMGIIGLAAVIAVPSYVRANSSAQKNACISNMYQIREAMHQWALETKAPYGSPVQFSNIRVYLRNTISCPAGGTNFSDSYTITDTATQPACKKVPNGVYAHILPLDVTQ